MLRNVTIVSKIMIGFGVLFALLLGVSGFAYFGIDHSKESFNQYRELARDSVLAGRLQANMLMVRFHTKRFLKTGSKEDVREYKRREKLMLQFIEEATKDIRKPERAEKVALIHELVDGYIKSFDKIVAYKKKRDEIIYRALDPSGLAMREAMTDIIESAYNDGDLTAAYFAGRTQEHLLLGRLYATKFLDTNKMSAVERLNEELATKIEPTINRLRIELQNPERIALFEIFLEKRNVYLDNFKNLVELIRDRNRIIDNELDRIGPIIADAAENIKLSVKRDQDILGPKVKERNEQIIRRIIYICIASLIIAVLLSVLIVRAINKPMGILVDTVDKCGEGDLDIRVDIKSGDEIGKLAVSFNKMAERLRENRDSLETLVDERTKELRDSQRELVSAERFAVLGKLSGGIAHEIRNPLSVIDSSAYYLSRKLKDADGKTKEHLGRISSQIKITSGIIQSLQDLTKMKDPNRTRSDVVKIIDEGIMLSNIPRGVELVKKMPKDKHFVYVDGKQLSMVFRNVLTNAVQAMNDKGTIYINVDDAENKGANVTIKDTGPGIKPEDLSKIFHSFFGTKTSGFGFGLTICQMIMDKNGGTIKAQSELGKGAAFTLYIPSEESTKGVNHEE